MSNDVGILDTTGKNLNPLNGLPYSDNYKTLAQIWSKFPAYKTAKKIIDDISNHQVILVISGTGSGKTVLIPKYMLHAFNYNKDTRIVVTLPKRIIAKSAAEFAAETLDVKLGEQVGYQFKGEKKKSDKTNLLYATDGTIVSMLIKDPYLKDFDAVIIDEAHERKVQIDFLLYLLRETIKLRPTFKLVIMSATIDETIFKNYFSDMKFINVNVGSATNYPIKSIFLDKSISQNEYIKEGNRIINEIIRTDIITKSNMIKAHDILFFVTSINETLDFCTNFDSPNNNLNKNVFCIEVYAGISEKNQLLAQDRDQYKLINVPEIVFARNLNNTNTSELSLNKPDEVISNKYDRKLVIATNVAESSLTIDGIKYVIDAGYELSSYYNPLYRAKILEKQLISQAQAKQRMGRAGRTESGICYHLYTEDTFTNGMKKFPEPDILTSNIYGECLRLLALPEVITIDNLRGMLNNFIQPPTKKYVDSFIDTLQKLNLVDSNKITKLGEIIVETQTDPIDGVCLLLAYKLNCMREVASVISLLDVMKNNMGELFIKPKMPEKEDNSNYRRLMDKYKKSIKKLNHPYGDHIVLYKIINKYRSLRNKNKEKLNQWAYEKFIKLNVLNRAHEQYHKLKNNCLKIFENQDKQSESNDDINFEEIKKFELADKILLCFIYGNKLLNAAHLDKKSNSNSNSDSYITEYGELKNVTISKDSFINFLDSSPRNVIYGELFGTNNNYDLNIVSKIPTKLDEITNKIKLNA
ncbi:MAG: HrpA-like RNA helicase [Terrestrivirus sp.]|uniref:RNA helicase n=1 Tax=Terrestrivirus sp. TaxID=2487775 RepID=A0A3G4ZQ15_9VIRU|nr:MAG: HrpA-like RNA helicase [Terrestrivirus sp.]